MTVPAVVKEIRIRSDQSEFIEEIEIVGETDAYSSGALGDTWAWKSYPVEKGERIVGIFGHVVPRRTYQKFASLGFIMRQ